MTGLSTVQYIHLQCMYMYTYIYMFSADAEEPDTQGYGDAGYQ